jgi:hypothetical protein
MKPNVMGHKVVYTLTFAVIAMLLGAVASRASSISYNVSRTIGAGSVIGTIETNGTTGVLHTANIIDWNLQLSDGTNTYNLTGPLSGNDSGVFISGSDVTASTSQLFFNFSGADAGYLLFQVTFGSGQQYYCDSANQVLCLQGESVVPQSFSTGFQNVSLSGNAVIGTSGSPVSPVNPVPEPEPCGLTLVGLGLLGLARKRLVLLT